MFRRARTVQRERPANGLLRPRSAAVVAALVAVAAAAVSAAPASSATTTARATTPNCGTAPVTLNAYFETGFPLPTDLTKEFTKQFPNVKFKIREDQFAVITANAPRVLNSSNAPDLIRVPTISDLVKDKLLKNLDPYVKAFGWNKWPASQLSQNRLTPDGKSRGAGSLFAFGLNYSMTGVFYNKKLAAQIGMTSPPTTVAQLDADMAKAKAANIQPIMQFNKGTGGLAFPLQDLMGAYGPPGPISKWIFQKPGATIDTPSNQTAAAHLQQWIQNGYFESDANAVDYATMMRRASPGWPSSGRASSNGARRDRRRHVLRVLAVDRAVLELDHRVLPLSAQLLELVATALPERPLHDLVLGTGGVQCLLHPPAWMPVDLHPHVRAAVELDGHCDPRFYWRPASMVFVSQPTTGSVAWPVAVTNTSFDPGIADMAARAAARVAVGATNANAVIEAPIGLFKRSPTVAANATASVGSVFVNTA